MVALLCSVGFAEGFNFAENAYPSADYNSRLISGGFWSCGDERSGGFGEFGWALVDETKNNFVLRDCFTVGGWGHQVIEHNVDFGELQVGNKFMIGGVYDCGFVKVRSYGFLGAGIGFIGGTNIRFFSGAPMVEINGGGGFEIQYCANNAFVIEFGGRCEEPIGSKRSEYKAYTNSSPVLTIGYRTLLD